MDRKVKDKSSSLCLSAFQHIILLREDVYGTFCIDEGVQCLSAFSEGTSRRPCARNTGAVLCRDRTPNPDEMLGSRNHVCATEFFNLAVTPQNASGPITGGPNWICSKSGLLPLTPSNPPFHNWWKNKIGGEKWIQGWKKGEGETREGWWVGGFTGFFFFLTQMRSPSSHTHTHVCTRARTFINPAGGSWKWERWKEKEEWECLGFSHYPLGPFWGYSYKIIWFRHNFSFKRLYCLPPRLIFSSVINIAAVIRSWMRLATGSSSAAAGQLAGWDSGCKSDHVSQEMHTNVKKKKMKT